MTKSVVHEIEIDLSDDPRTVAIIPGAFKPPTRAHLGLVESYLTMADEVLILISAPTRKGRSLPNGKEVTAEISKQIWEMLLSSEALMNVKVEISPHASPITAAYEMIGDDGPFKVGDTIILGVGDKGNDPKRFSGAGKYVKEGVNFKVIPGQLDGHSREYLTLLDSWDSYEQMPSAGGGNPEAINASDLRFILGKVDEGDDVARHLLGDFVFPENVDKILSIFGILNNLGEMSAAGAGAVSGFAGSLGTIKKRKNNFKEVDASLVNEIYKLFIEKGIIQ